RGFGVGREHGTAGTEVYVYALLGRVVVERVDSVVGDVDALDGAVGCLLRRGRAAARGVRDGGQLINLSRHALRVLLGLAQAVLGGADAALDGDDVGFERVRGAKV